MSKAEIEALKQRIKVLEEQENTPKLKKRILDTLDDLMSNFLYYDRKEDCDLEVGDIERAIEEGVITVDEMVEAFRAHLEEK